MCKVPASLVLSSPLLYRVLPFVGELDETDEERMSNFMSDQLLDPHDFACNKTLHPDVVNELEWTAERTAEEVLLFIPRLHVHAAFVASSC